MPRAPRITVCAGPDCARDERKAYKDLVDRAQGAGVELCRTRCMKVCHGPVAILDVDGSPVVVSRLRGAKDRAAVVEGSLSGRLPKRLRKVTVTGTKAKKALARRAA